MIAANYNPQHMGMELALRVAPAFRRDCARAVVLSPAIFSLGSTVFHGDGRMIH